MSLYRGALISLIIKTGTAGATFLFFLITAKILEPSEYGRFGYFFSIAMFLSYVIMFGKHTLLLRWISAYRSTNEISRITSLIRRSFFSIFSVWLVSSLIMLLVVFFFPSEIKIDYLELFLISAYSLAFAISEAFISLLRAFDRISAALVPRDIIWRLIFLVTSVATYTALSQEIDADTVFAILVISLYAVVLTQLAYVVLVVRELTKTGSEVEGREQNAPETGTIWFWFAGVAGVASANLSVAFTSYVLTDAQTGGFLAAQKVSLLLQLPLVSMNIVLAPKIADLFYNKQFSEIQKIFRYFSLLLLLYGAVSFSIIYLFSNDILYLFDPKFSEYENALVILSFGMLVNTLSGPTGVLLLMSGMERSNVILVAVFESAGLALLFPLGASFGVQGVAFASATGTILWNLAAVYICRSKLSLDPSLMCHIRRF